MTMSNSFILLVIIFLSLYFGYPKYEEYQFTEAVREELKTSQIEIPKFDGFPAEANIENDYPRQLMTIRLTDMRYEDIPPALRSEIRKEMEHTVCRSMKKNIVFLSEAKHEAFTKIFHEDQNSIKIVLRDKSNGYIADHTQRLSECSIFSG